MVEFMFTSTVRDTDCPKCFVLKGEQCKTPKGRKAWPPHHERQVRYQQLIGTEELRKRHTVKIMSFSEFFNMKGNEKALKKHYRKVERCQTRLNMSENGGDI